MPDIGSAPNKTHQRTDGTRTGDEVWQEAKAVPVKIRADAHDTHDQDLSDALSNRWMRDGGNQPSADLPMNAKKFTGVANAAARTQFAAAGQVADSTLTYGGTAGGSANTITATLSPAITDYVTGQRYHFKAANTNSGAATINFNSVGAATINKGAAGATALAAGDITTGGIYTVEYDGTNFQLVNPGLGRNISAFAATLLDDASAAAMRTTLDVPVLSGGNIFTPGASTVQSDWLQLVPSDFGANKPFLFIQKTTTADRYNIGLFDGADTGGKIDFAVSELTHNNAPVLSTANPTVNPGALIAILEDRQTSGTAGGTFTSGADRTRVLNTEVFNRSSTVTLSSNQFVLPAGNWEIAWSAPGFQVDAHQTILRDVTAGADVQRGTTERSELAEEDLYQTRSFGCARVSPAGANTYEIRHRCVTTRATDGLGSPASLGTEVYTQVIIRAA